MPRVSVIIPAYNAERTIAPAIDSVLAQTFSDYEIVVVNDGSTDGTPEVLDSYGNRIRHICQDNRGRGAARNAAIRHATGEYLAFLDADDVWLPDKLTRQVDLLEGCPELALVYSWAKAFDPRGCIVKTLGTSFPSENAHGMDAFEGLVLGKSLPTLTVIVRASCLDQVGLFDESIARGQDWDLWLRIALRYRIGHVPRVLASYRLSESFMPAEFDRCNKQDTRVQSIYRIFREARQLPDREHCLALESLALAKALWWGSLVDYAVGKVTSAKLRWFRALEQEASFFFEARQEWVQSIVDFATSLYDTITPQAEAEAVVHFAFNNSPIEAAPLLRLRRRVIGEIRAGYAFQMLEKGNVLLARRLMRQAALYYPPLLCNLGVTSVCMRKTWMDEARQKLRHTEK